MTSKFNASNSSEQPLSANSPVNGNSGAHPQDDGRDDSKLNAAPQPLGEVQAAPLRDRFELLSAYLDGEVTAAERRQVEDWLANDLSVQRLHTRLLKLRQGMRSTPIPVAEQPIEHTVRQVFSRLERRPRRAMVWGGMAIAAMFVGLISGELPGQRTATQMVEAPQPVDSEALMIALDHPVIEIPKAPVSSSGQSLYEAQNNVR